MFRLMLILVSLLMALPAAAAPPCHAPARVTLMSHHAAHTPAPAPTAALHECIGCIPPGDWLAARIAPRPLAAPAPAATPTPRLALAPAAPPATPPPRHG